MTQQIETHTLLGKEFEDITNRYTDTYVREGNKVVLLPSGVSSYEMRWKLIEKARQHIHIVAFSLMKDETSYRLRDLLLKKLKEKVEVRMIFDDGVMISTLSGNILKELEAAGAKTIRYHKVFRDCLPDFSKGAIFKQLVSIFKLKLKRRFHEKYLVIDGKEAILGGINWGNKYAFGGVEPKAWRDSDIYVSGPVVADLQRQFIHDYCLYTAMDQEYYERNKPGFNKKEFFDQALQKEKEFINNQETAHLYFPDLSPQGNEKTRYIAHKPYDENRLRLTDAYLLMFKEATKYIYWGCHGIRPPRIIAEALAEAVKRNVEVRLITNSHLASRTLMGYGLLGWMYWESSNHFRWLIEHGIHVHEWQKPGAFHSKNLVIDDVVASVGSYNIARGSTFNHTESNIIIYGGELPVQVRNQFAIDLRDCREISLAEAKIVNPKYDPFKRPIEERNLLINPQLLTAAVRHDLELKYFKKEK